MDNFLYLISNGDLYNIGSCSNLEKTQELLKPGQLFSYLKTKEAASMSKKLRDRYSESRLPESNYFRLSKSQLLECQLMMKSDGSRDYFRPIFKGKILILTFLLSWLSFSLILIKFAIQPIFNKFL